MITKEDAIKAHGKWADRVCGSTPFYYSCTRQKNQYSSCYFQNENIIVLYYEKSDWLFFLPIEKDFSEGRGVPRDIVYDIEIWGDNSFERPYPDQEMYKEFENYIGVE